jgi:hypothetical protein
MIEAFCIHQVKKVGSPVAPSIMTRLVFGIFLKRVWNLRDISLFLRNGPVLSLRKTSRCILDKM